MLALHGPRDRRNDGDARVVVREGIAAGEWNTVYLAGDRAAEFI